MMDRKYIVSHLIIYVVFSLILPCVSSAATIKGEGLGRGVSCIVIDAGFGGHDFGASGYLKGIHSKDVNLQIAKRLAKRIGEELHVEVIMTRNSDRYIPLAERTAIANLKGWDVFISIHCNAHRDRRAYGIETYFFNFTKGDRIISLNGFGKAISIENMSDLQIILSDLMQSAITDASRSLAGDVQEALYNHMRERYNSIKNRGIKQAPFYVLMGTKMPAILIATSFISNPRECKRLISTAYQDDLCQAITRGIRSYIEEAKTYDP